ncbi:vitamin K epoxide reductase complex [Loa loa]|uniref:vitamin-K-epoxide reductase (warfarin-sensitive) n=1 Tax=Loa loa TaxID=7209 RepID=A0A1S0TY38_LOALO|nr:vitamin K epoxide reductase complex [Loa loa]EFO22117.1 vitamin K epoxide reductase complex [Loa loa]
MAFGSYSLSPNHTCAAISFIGLAISFYTLYVEYNLDSDINYQPMCDIAYYVSCSKAFRSPFAKGFGVASSILETDHILMQVRQINIQLFDTIKCVIVKRLCKKYENTTPNLAH